MTNTVGSEKLGVTAAPIQASTSQGGIDGSLATLRYLVTILTAFPVIFALLKAKDIVAIYQWTQSNEGMLFVAALVAVGTPAYGIFRTWWRGRQVAAVAADRRVDDDVARLN
jgi:hypothetical protein